MALEQDPEFIESYLNLSYCHKRLGRYGKSAQILRELIKIDPENIRALSELANAHFNMGDTTLAINMNLDIIKKRPDEILPFINLGKYYILLKDTLQGIKYFESAYQIDNYHPDACYNLYFFYTALKQPEKAAKYYYKLNENKQNFKKQTLYD
jgi:tetratricopeptide (TPR) repeat protein